MARQENKTIHNIMAFFFTKNKTIHNIIAFY